MERKPISGILLTLLLFCMLPLAFNICTIRASLTIIYIKADGSIDPPEVPIQRYEDVYNFTDNIYADYIVIQKDDIVIDGKGYTLNGSVSGYRGFYISHRKNVTVKNVQITGFSDGIYLYNSNSCRILNNTVSECGYAIEARVNSFNNTISENNVVNSEVGIWFLQCSNSTISRNNITATNKYAVWLDYRSYYNILSDNDITNNNWGIFLDQCSSNSISGNNVTNNVKGIDLWSCSNNEVYENNVTKNGYGVYLSRASNNTFSRNTMSGNKYSFSVWGFELLQFVQSIDASNLVDEKPVCYVLNQRDLVINPTTYPEIGYLALVNSSNIIVESQTLTNNGQGLLFAYTNDSRIKSNHIVNNFNGIRLYSSFNNTFSENNITNNPYGIIFYTSSDNKFYYNNFVNNTMQIHVYQSGYANLWDYGYPPGGNYWSDHVSPDVKTGSNQDQLGKDGIADTPYTIDENNRDCYPLMAMFYTFKAGTWNNTTYNVDFISNSTPSDFYFKPEEGAFIRFNVTSQNETVGFCRVTIPEDLLWVENGKWTVVVDGEQITDYATFSDENNTYLYFNYNHSTKTVQIIGTHAIPEFPSIMILSPFILATLIATVLLKNKKQTESKHFFVNCQKSNKQN